MMLGAQKKRSRNFKVLWTDVAIVAYSKKSKFRNEMKTASATERRRSTRNATLQTRKRTRVILWQYLGQGGKATRKFHHHQTKGRKIDWQYLKSIYFVSTCFNYFWHSGVNSRHVTCPFTRLKPVDSPIVFIFLRLATFQNESQARISNAILKKIGHIKSYFEFQYNLGIFLSLHNFTLKQEF